MEFSLQISEFSWLMFCISINRVGKDRHGSGLSKEEGMRKRKVKRNGKKRTTTQAQNLFLEVHETISVRKYRCSSVNHWIFLQLIGATYREITSEHLIQT